jgi:hypothetical protein
MRNRHLPNSFFQASVCCVCVCVRVRCRFFGVTLCVTMLITPRPFHTHSLTCAFQGGAPVQQPLTHQAPLSPRMAAAHRVTSAPAAVQMAPQVPQQATLDTQFAEDVSAAALVDHVLLSFLF